MEKIRLTKNIMCGKTFDKVLVLIFYFCATIFVFSCTEEINIEEEYYKSGQIKYQVPIRNGKRDGTLKEYYENGKLFAISKYEDGKLEGESKIYFESGKIKQKHIYKNGIRCCESKFYHKEGYLREIQFIDNKGRVKDYIKYKKDGSQDLSINTRRALIINEFDTIMLGEFYLAKIRLGNPQYNSIEAILGDPNDRKILLNEKLPKIDSVTALLKIKGEKLGENKITGVIVDIDINDRSEMVVIPFEHSFYVKQNKL